MSVLSTQSTGVPDNKSSGFAAERSAMQQEVSIDSCAGAQQQTRAASRWQPTEDTKG